MKSLGIINTSLLSSDFVQHQETVDILGTKVTCGLVEVKQPAFDSSSAENLDYVLIHVDAFSCNYRDKALIVKAALRMEKDSHSSLPVSYFGSDFVGTVIATGDGVEHLRKGMRVIPNCYYPYQEYDGIATGVVTNEASKGWLKLHKSKVLEIPSKMSDVIAAAFSIGGQTSSSLIRRCMVKQSDRILVTSARSNTSLFVIKSLLTKGNDVTALTTSEWSEEEKEFISPAKLVTIERGIRNWDHLFPDKFDVIIDPFYDLNLLNALPYLNFDGRYITCGFKNQHQTFCEATDDLRTDRFDKLMVEAMIHNLYIIGNCIGTTEDLKSAIEDYEFNLPPIPIYQQLRVENGAQFLDSTYNSQKRFGKVVMMYGRYFWE